MGASERTGEGLSPCRECGASGESGSCEELFHRLLALDHRRLQPWARFHGLNVACFFLQHPSTKSPAELGGLWQMVTAYLERGIDGVDAITSERVGRSRRGERGFLSFAEPPARVRPATTTIAEVSADGTFPAEGYTARVQSWAESIAHERQR